LFDTEALKAYSNTRQCTKDEVIIKEGEESPYSLYIIISGSVQVIKDYGHSDQSVVTVLNKGDFFGEMSLFMKKPRSATIVAAEESVLLEVTQENIHEVIRLNPQTFYSIFKTLCVRVDELKALCN